MPQGGGWTEAHVELLYLPTWDRMPTWTQDRIAVVIKMTNLKIAIEQFGSPLARAVWVHHPALEGERRKYGVNPVILNITGYPFP